MLKILFIAISLFSSSAMAFKPGTGIIEKNWVACDTLQTLSVATMLLASNQLAEFNDYMDKNGDNCFVMTQRGTVKILGKKTSLVGDVLEFRIDGIDKNLFALKSGFSH